MSTISSECRIEPAAAPYEPWIEESFARMTPPGMEPLRLFRVLARNPRVLKRLFAGHLLDKGSIGMREREIVILRTCARCGSEYEWGVHVAAFSKVAGFSSAEVAATVNFEINSSWSGREAALIKLVDELHDNAAVSDPVWESLVLHYTVEQVIELIVLVGYYHALSFVTNAARIELESTAPRFSSMT